MCLRNVFSFFKPNKQNIQFKQNEIMKLIIKLLLTLTIVTTTLLLDGLNTSKANGLADENISAVESDNDNPLCLAYTFSFCYLGSGACSYHISPNYVCRITVAKGGTNPN